MFFPPVVDLAGQVVGPKSRGGGLVAVLRLAGSLISFCQIGQVLDTWKETKPVSSNAVTFRSMPVVSVSHAYLTPVFVSHVSLTPVFVCESRFLGCSL